MSEENFEPYTFHDKVLSDLEEKLNHYKKLAKYTKKTVKLNQHKFNIKFMEGVILEYHNELIEEYELQ